MILIILSMKSIKWLRKFHAQRRAAAATEAAVTETSLSMNDDTAATVAVTVNNGDGLLPDLVDDSDDDGDEGGDDHGDDDGDGNDDGDEDGDEYGEGVGDHHGNDDGDDEWIPDSDDNDSDSDDDLGGKRKRRSRDTPVQLPIASLNCDDSDSNRDTGGDDDDGDADNEVKGLLTEAGLLDYLTRLRGPKDSRTTFIRFVKFLERSGVVRTDSVEGIPDMLLSVKSGKITTYPSYLSESSKFKPSTVIIFIIIVLL